MRSSGPGKPTEEWSDPRHRLGAMGEEIAASYLAREGYAILARRFRLGHHDLDLVVRRKRLVAFIEVKTRRSDRFGPPLRALGFRQRRSLAKVAAVWVDRYGREGDEYRFDLVVIDLTRRGKRSIRHVENAWYADR